ncbi:hypothetical protein MAL1_00139 [Bacteriophage DSS3_MAL1]|nr:hypothetical protein MAL1_00139 [Bacteriophage DSS3_MAL1]
MKHIKTYKTKSKWRANLDAAGLPVVGYDHYAKGEGEKQLDPGVNVLIHGSLMLIGTSRGRSAAHFDLYAASEWRAHMTMKGTEKLFHSVAEGLTTMQMDTWRVISRGYGGNVYADDEVTAPAFRGYWTLAKQGTEFSIIPAPSEIIP